MVRRKKRSHRALGDDPLSWISENHGADQHKNTGAKVKDAAHRKRTKLSIEKKPAKKKRTSKAKQKHETGKEIISPVKSKSVTDKKGQQQITIILEPVITITEAAALKSILLSSMNIDVDVKIDATGVQQIDTAGLQVLLALSFSLKKHSLKINWTGISSPLINTAKLLGLDAALGLGK